MEENNLLQIKLDKNIYYSFVDKNIIKNGEKITLTKNEVHISELPDSDAGVVPDTFAMRFSRV